MQQVWPGAVRRSLVALVLLAGAAGCGGAADGRSDSESQADAGPPSYVEHIAPLLARTCMPCHAEGGSGPFRLDHYSAAMRRGEQLARVTASGFMPPWKPVEGYGEFQGARRLSPDERQLIGDWVAAGTPRGDGPAPAPEPRADGWRLGEPDLVLTPGAPYEVRAEESEEWRCVRLPTGLGAARAVRAVEVLPSNPRVVHHAIAYLGEADSGAPREARGLCSDTSPLTGLLGGWVPGLRPSPYPAGTGVTLAPGEDVLLELHYRASGRPEPEHTRVGLYFTEQPPAPEHELALVTLGVVDLMLPAGEAAVVVEDALRLPGPIVVHAILPHAHYVCTSVRVWVELEGGGEVPLIWIDDWDLAWQDFYRYVEPVALPSGATLRLRFVYDNSTANPRNPFFPPRRVVGGSRSIDEMASVYLQVTSPDDSALAELGATARARASSGVVEAGWWRFLVQTFDRDGDHALDADEDAAASAFLRELWLERALDGAVLDLDGDGAVGPAEEQRARSALLRWGLEPDELR